MKIRENSFPRIINRLVRLHDIKNAVECDAPACLFGGVSIDRFHMHSPLMLEKSLPSFPFYHSIPSRFYRLLASRSNQFALTHLRGASRGSCTATAAKLRIFTPRLLVMKARRRARSRRYPAANREIKIPHTRKREHIQWEKRRAGYRSYCDERVYSMPSLSRRAISSTENKAPLRRPFVARTFYTLIELARVNNSRFGE